MCGSGAELIVIPPVVTTTEVEAFWPSVSVKLAEQVPAATPTAVYVALGPLLLLGGEIVAMPEQVSLSVKAPLYPVCCTEMFVVLLGPVPVTLMGFGLTVRTLGGALLGEAAGTTIGVLPGPQATSANSNP